MGPGVGAGDGVGTLVAASGATVAASGDAGTSKGDWFGSLVIALMSVHGGWASGNTFHASRPGTAALGTKQTSLVSVL